jgi:hypothetical protein
MKKKTPFKNSKRNQLTATDLLDLTFLVSSFKRMVFQHANLQIRAEKNSTLKMTASYWLPSITNLSFELACEAIRAG